PLENKLQSLYENASISGYGNVKKQTTEFDPEVRNARELIASEFVPSAKLVDIVAQIWKESFYSPNIRVEPYKIHVYGPNGMFRSHLDTPEMDLIGTFLVGLGDTTTPTNRLKVADKYFSATPFSWVAFYSDTPHSVEHIESGYRAVIAFKIFRSQSIPEEVTSTTPETDKTVDDLPDTTFILGLVHQYPTGVEELVGFDRLLLNALRRRTDLEVHLLPVLVDYRSATDEEYLEGNYFHARVYPLTDAHLNYLLGDKEAIARDESIRWMKHLKESTLFYKISREWDQVWKEHIGQGPGYTGNESRGQDQHSIYLSYGLAILSKAAMHQGVDEAGVPEE
ncbi:hypothetical protein K474DRAFT_1608219, partial [Panus rudis PR-1116 ss-1]